MINLDLKIKYIENFSGLSMVLNLATIVLGILHYIIGLNLVFGVAFSIIIFLAWIFNIFLIIIDEYMIAKESSIGKRLNMVGYGYLLFQIIAILLLVGGLFLYNASWFSPILQYALIWCGFFGLFIFGTLFSFLNYHNSKKNEVWNIE